MPQWLVIGVSGVTCGGKTTLAASLRDYFHSQRNTQLWQTPYVLGDVQLFSQDDYFLSVGDMRHKWDAQLNAINFELITSLDMKQMLSDITWTMEGRYLATHDPMDNLDYINEIAMSTNFEHYTQANSPPLAAATVGGGLINRYATQGHHHAQQQHHPQQPEFYAHHQGYRLGKPNGQLVGHLNNTKSLPPPPPPTSAGGVLRVNPQTGSLLHQHDDHQVNILIIEGFMIFNQPELLTLCNIKFHLHLPYERCYERRQKRTYDPPDVTGYFEVCVWPHYEKNFAQYRDREDITFLNGEIAKERIFKFALGKINSYIEERCDAAACPPPQKFLGIRGSSVGLNIVGSGLGGGAKCSGGGGGSSIVNGIKACPMDQQ